MKILFTILLIITLGAGCDFQNQKLDQPDDLPQKQSKLNQKPTPTSKNDINKIYDLAKQGLVNGSDFGVIDSTINQVIEQLGKPDKIDQTSNGYYATYEKRAIAFGYSKSGQIFDVRSFSKELQKITLSDLTNILGSPDKITKYQQDDIYTYNLNQLVLKFIIPKNKTGVDHISVYNEVRSKTDAYVLKIKGNSNQLSELEWANMLKWREQIYNFVSKQEHVFLNGPNQKMVALTFDDGPDDEVTPAIIDILKQYGITGNFFFEGRKVVANPTVVQNAFGNGNLVLSHTFNHRELTKLSKNEVKTEIQKTEDAIESIIGKRPAILRTPFGETNEKVVTIAQDNGYSIVLWSIDTLDWSQKESDHIVQNIIQNIRNGDIILMHSDTEHSEDIKALPRIIEELQKRNYQIVGLDTLLNIKAYQ